MHPTGMQSCYLEIFFICSGNNVEERNNIKPTFGVSKFGL